MVSLYSREFDGGKNGPVAAPSPNSENARRILTENKDNLVSGVTVKGLVTYFAASLSQLVSQPSSGNRIKGYQLMDIVTDARTKLDVHTIKLQTRASWTALLDRIPCLIGVNMGDIITGSRSKAINSPCNHLPTGRNYLAATINFINGISQWQDQEHLQISSFRLLPGGVWFASAEIFATCDHDGKSDEGCWQSPSFVQYIVRYAKSRSLATPTQEIPENGVIVFGDKRTNRFPFLRGSRRAQGSGDSEAKICSDLVSVVRVGDSLVSCFLEHMDTLNT